MSDIPVPKALFEQLIADQLDLEHMLESQLIEVRKRIKNLESAKALLARAEEQSIAYGRVMSTAHAHCPLELSHLDKMRWMADYFVTHATLPTHEANKPSVDSKRQDFPQGAQLTNLYLELDTDEHGNNRCTPDGNIWRIESFDQESNHYSLICEATGAAILVDDKEIVSDFKRVEQA